MRASICLFILCLFSAVAHATPNIQTWQTDSGSKVLLVEAHELAMVDIEIMFDAGTARDADKPGLASLTNHLLSQGAAGKNVDEISDIFESLGAVYGSGVELDYASLSLRSLSDADKLETALNNLIDVLARPDFPADAFERERDRSLIGIASKKQSPSAIARDALYEALYGNHPYAQAMSGTEESVSALTVADLKAFYERHYLANNAVIAMVGDISREQAEDIANRLTADLPTAELPEPLPEVKPLQESKTISIPHPSGQVHIRMAQPAYARGHPDHFALYVGNHVLGGGGMVSRLFAEIREKRGLSYGASSYFNPLRKQGPFLAGLSTRADQTEEAIQVLRDNIKRFIEEGPTAAELEASKKNITGGFPLRIDSNSKILAYISVIGFYDLPLDYLDVFNSRIEAVTIEDIKRAFKNILDADRLVTVKVGPVEEQE